MEAAEAQQSPGKTARISGPSKRVAAPPQVAPCTLALCALALRRICYGHSLATAKRWCAASLATYCGGFLLLWLPGECQQSQILDVHLLMDGLVDVVEHFDVHD